MRIEQRLKVSVVLIPNVHLETPNYTVTRLRHDELNQMEPLPASYRMMDQPTEAEKPAVPGVEAKARPRPQAAVQGITPGAARAGPGGAGTARKPSILQKIFGWLTRKPEEKPEPVKTKPREQRRPPREGARPSPAAATSSAAVARSRAAGATRATPRGLHSSQGVSAANAANVLSSAVSTETRQQAARPEAVTQARRARASGERRGERREARRSAASGKSGPDRGERQERAERQNATQRSAGTPRCGTPERSGTSGSPAWRGWSG